MLTDQLAVIQQGLLPGRLQDASKRQIGREKNDQYRDQVADHQHFQLHDGLMMIDHPMPPLGGDDRRQAKDHRGKGYRQLFQETQATQSIGVAGHETEIQAGDAEKQHPQQDQAPEPGEVQDHEHRAGDVEEPPAAESVIDASGCAALAGPGQFMDFSIRQGQCDPGQEDSPDHNPGEDAIAQMLQVKQQFTEPLKILLVNQAGLRKVGNQPPRHLVEHGLGQDEQRYGHQPAHMHPIVHEDRLIAAAESEVPRHCRPDNQW